MPNKLRDFSDLLLEMTSREIKARYKNTIFGFLWVIINPLLQMVVIGLIFKSIIKGTGANYYYFIYTGLVVWNFFSLSLTKATTSIVFERALIRKAKFPYSVIPLSIIFSNFIHTLPSIIILSIIALLLNTLTILSLIYLALALMLILMFTIGISLSTSVLNVRYRDIAFFVQAVLIVWFYATPVIYSLSSVPEDIKWLWVFNPLTSIIELFQYSILNTPFPSLSLLIPNTLVVIFICIIGLVLFQSHSKYFDDLL